MLGSRQECFNNYLAECTKLGVPNSEQVWITTFFGEQSNCIKSAKVSDCVCKHCYQMERLLRRWGAAMLADKDKQCTPGCKCKDGGATLSQAAVVARGGSIAQFYAAILKCPKQDILGKATDCVEGNTCTCIAEFVTEFVGCQCNKASTTPFVWLQYGAVRVGLRVRAALRLWRQGDDQGRPLPLLPLAPRGVRPALLEPGLAVVREVARAAQSRAL